MRRQWEYLTFEWSHKKFPTYADRTEELDRLGSDGWVLVHVDGGVVYMKRMRER